MTGDLKQSWEEFRLEVESGVTKTGVLLIRAPGERPRSVFVIESLEEDLSPVISALEDVLNALKTQRLRISLPGI